VRSAPTALQEKVKEEERERGETERRDGEERWRGEMERRDGERGRRRESGNKIEREKESEGWGPDLLSWYACQALTAVLTSPTSIFRFDCTPSAQ